MYCFWRVLILPALIAAPVLADLREDFWEYIPTCTRENCTAPAVAANSTCTSDYTCTCRDEVFINDIATCVGDLCQDEIEDAYFQYNWTCSYDGYAFLYYDDEEEFRAVAEPATTTDIGTGDSAPSLTNASSDAQSSNQPSEQSDGFSTSDRIAIGVGLGVGLPTIVIGVLAIFLQRRWRARPQPYQQMPDPKPSFSAPSSHESIPLSTELAPARPPNFEMSTYQETNEQWSSQSTLVPEHSTFGQHQPGPVSQYPIPVQPQPIPPMNGHEHAAELPAKFDHLYVPYPSTSSHSQAVEAPTLPPRTHYSPSDFAPPLPRRQ